MAPDPILEFDAVTVGSPPGYDTGLWNASLALRPGDLALVRVEDAHPRVPLADLAQGLCAPDAGRVTLLGSDWDETDPRRASALRGRTGRMFDATAWVSGLSVAENILLPQRYHAPDRPPADLHDEAAQLARMFGLPGLPLGKPHQVRPHDLRRAACVRCFLGRPDVVLLERPTAGPADDLMPPLANAVRSARRRGAAVLWTAELPEVWSDAGLRPSHSCSMAGAQLLVSPAAGPAGVPGPGETSGPRTGAGEKVTL